MNFQLILAAATDGPIQQIADRFGVNWALLTSQMVCFVIVALVLRKFAYAPVLALLDERRRTIKESLENAEQIKKELTSAQVKAQQILSDAAAQAQRLLDEAKEAAGRVQVQKAQEAVNQAESIISQAREVATLNAERMKADLRKEIGRLVVDTTTKVIGKVLTPEDQKRLTEETLKEMSVVK
ncbi:MAG: F0F1 ATP synthase subunit B [Verrucomicrobiota bacterium]|nr:F0F1 ATP synthase subunit B [Verrucomicrobiota bacterium]